MPSGAPAALIARPGRLPPRRPRPGKPFLFLSGADDWHPDPRLAQWLPSMAEAAAIAAHYEGAFAMALSDALAAWEARPGAHPQTIRG